MNMKHSHPSFPARCKPTWSFCTATLGLLFATFLLLGADVALATQNRFEPDILKFEEMDKVQAPVKNAVLFTGSSSIRRWKTLEEDFTGFEVLNRGFGGSQFNDLLHFFDRVILPYHPSIIVIYSGSHDLHHGKRSPQEVLQMVKTFHDKVQAQLPETKVFYISLKPSISKWDKIGLDQETNHLIRAYAEETEGIEFIDIWTPMIAEGSPPPEKYFMSDLNHLNREGYQLWASVIRSHLEKYISPK